MEKKFFNLLPYFLFECKKELLSELLEIIKNEENLLIKGKNTLNETLKNNDNSFYHEKFLDWVDECLLEVKKELCIKQEITLEVISCWANKTKKMQGHHIHTHPNSFLSGILYLTSHDSGFTHFVKENYFLEKFNVFSLSDLIHIEEKLKPNAGTLIIFPSHLQHKVSALTANESRYTIAFNVFPSGKLGGFTADLTLDIKSLRQLNLEK